jgi:hypothetical protein
MPEKAVPMSGKNGGEGGGDSDNMTSESKDENAVNHEIATLLLNLASRTSSLGNGGGGGGDDKMAAGGAKAADVAMDLSIYAKSNSVQKQQQQQQTSSSGGGFQSAAVNGGGVGSNPYSLFPLSSVPALPSSYLLQNLLIGEFSLCINQHCLSAIRTVPYLSRFFYQTENKIV